MLAIPETKDIMLARLNTNRNCKVAEIKMEE